MAKKQAFRHRPIDPSDPRWVKGQQSGYDPKSGKYRSWKGPYTKRENALEDLNPEYVYGAVSRGDLSPLSHAAEKLEIAISGFDIKRAQENWFTDAKENIRAIPSSILARMRLAEHFAATEGDVFQCLAIPIDVGLRFDPENDVQCSDKGLQRQLRDFYGEGATGIDLHSLFQEVSLCTSIYGNAFPIQIFPRKGDDPNAQFDHKRSPAVVCLNPKTVWVGRAYSVSQWDMALTQEGTAAWTEEMLKRTIPPMMYVSLVTSDNEMMQQGHIPLNPEYVFPVRDKAMSWERYALPLLSRALRSISTRQVLEEMVRATIEGYKNQLWIFKVGDPQNPASPNKIKRLIEKLDALNVERTGQLVWTYDLVVEQHTPKPLDQLIANEAWVNLTFHMFTQIGINPYFISGIKQGRSGTSEVGVDVEILVERIKAWHKQLRRLEYNIRRHWTEYEGMTEKDAAQVMAATVHLGAIDLNASERIKQRIQPLAQMGYLSNQTVVEGAGYSYALELERKKAEKRDAELFQPKATFAQQTVNPGTPETETKTAPQGRPTDGTRNADQGNKPEVQSADAAVPFASDLREYMADVNTLYDAFLISRDVDEFVLQLKRVNGAWLSQFAERGYTEAAGITDMGYAAAADRAAEFINGFANKFGRDMEASPEQDFRWRALMYPAEGHRLAYVLGQQQAMKEHGARAWRRILHPELSVSGPCGLCIADSTLIHPMDEDFVLLHPGDVCTVAETIAYFPVPPEAVPPGEKPEIEFPVPGRPTMPAIIQMLKDSLEQLGRGVKHIVRRIRGK